MISLDPNELCYFSILPMVNITEFRFKPFQLLQLVATVVFGAMIDIASSVLSGITPSSYPEQLLLCFIGIILVALGISIEVMAGLVTVPGEGMVLTISKVAGMKFGNMKVCFDVTLVITATSLSLFHFPQTSRWNKRRHIPCSSSCWTSNKDYKQAYRHSWKEDISLKILFHEIQLFRITSKLILPTTITNINLPLTSLENTRNKCPDTFEKYRAESKYPALQILMITTSKQ